MRNFSFFLFFLCIFNKTVAQSKTDDTHTFFAEGLGLAGEEDIQLCFIEVKKK